MGRIFINYRRQDSEGYVGRLFDHLLQHFDREEIFMDVDSIAPGKDFVAELENAVKACDVLISIIGPTWSRMTDENGERRLDQWNDFVRIEVATALKENKIVIPVLVGQAKMPAPNELPDDLAPLARRNAFVLSHLHFRDDVERLAKVIQESLPARVKTTGIRRSDPETYFRKEAALEQLRVDLENAKTSPLYPFRVQNKHKPVLGEGNPDANMIFIGESPGRVEAEEGRPFVGPSGEILEEMLQTIKLRRADVFVTNLLLDYSADDPTPEQIEFYAPFVDRLIDIIQPAVIAPLGRFAMGYVLKKFDLPEKRGKISELHGKLLKATMSYGEVFIVPMYHPASVLYSPTQATMLRRDFEKLKVFV